MTPNDRQRAAHPRLPLFGLLFVVSTLLSACSLVLPFGDECTTDQDCAGNGAGLRCVKKLCVVFVEGTDTDVASDTVADATDVADAAGSSDLPEDGVPAPVDVFDAGDGDVYSPPEAGDTADVPELPDIPPLRPEDLLTDTCSRIHGVPLENALDENTILIGSVLPLTGQLDLLGPFLDQAVELAVSEINGIGGLGGKKIAVLSCDSGTDPGVAIVSAAHLVSVARVPAIIGPVSSEITIEVFNRVAYPAGVLLVSPVAASPVMETLETDGLLWRTAPSATRLGYAFGEYLVGRDFEKVFVVNREDTWGTSMREAMQSVFCPLADCADSSRFRSLVYDTQNVAFSQSQVLVEVQAFDPDVVVLISYIQDGIAFLNAAAAATDNVRDFITPDGLRDQLALRYVASQEVLCRLFGMSFVPPAGAVYESFRIRFESKWFVPPAPYTASAYDAAYLLGYAMSVALQGGGELTGARIGAGMGRLSSGQRIEAGTGQWNTGRQALARSEDATIDYAGASGDVDFDPETGSVNGDVEGWHFNLDEGGPESLGTIYTIDGTYTPPDYGLADPDATCEAVLNPSK